MKFGSSNAWKRVLKNEEGVVIIDGAEVTKFQLGKLLLALVDGWKVELGS